MIRPINSLLLALFFIAGCAPSPPETKIVTQKLIVPAGISGAWFHLAAQDATYCSVSESTYLSVKVGDEYTCPNDGENVYHNGWQHD